MFVGLADGEEEFLDANSEDSVRASKFLEGLDFDPIIPELNKYYSVPEDKGDFSKRTMFKSMVFSSWYQESHHLLKRG